MHATKTARAVSAFIEPHSLVAEYRRRVGDRLASQVKPLRRAFRPAARVDRRAFRAPFCWALPRCGWALMSQADLSGPCVGNVTLDRIELDTACPRTTQKRTHLQSRRPVVKAKARNQICTEFVQ